MDALGQVEESTNENDCNMRSGVIYASAPGRASHENFNIIKRDSDIFSESQSGEINISTYAVGGSKAGAENWATQECIAPTARKARSRSSRESKDMVAGFVRTYLDRHPDPA